MKSHCVKHASGVHCDLVEDTALALCRYSAHQSGSLPRPEIRGGPVCSGGAVSTSMFFPVSVPGGGEVVP